MFEGSGRDTAGWLVTHSNLQELQEAMHLSDFISPSDVEKILAAGTDPMPFEQFKVLLAKELVEVRKISFKSLMHNDFTIPIDRISGFLKMLRAEIMAKESPSQVDQFYLEEIKFAQKSMNEKNM